NANGGDRVRELAAEPPKHSRLAVAQLVVDGDPAVPRAADDAARRTAEPRHILPHALLDRRLVVGLDVYGAETQTARSPFGTLEQLLDRGEESQGLSPEAEPLVRGLCVLVRHLHAERQHARALCVAQSRCRAADRLARRALTARLGGDVDVAEMPDPRMIHLREREPEDPAAVALGDERDVLVAEVLVELAELVLDVHRDAGRRRDLTHELLVELAQPFAVLRRCLANGHAGGATRRPVSR